MAYNSELLRVIDYRIKATGESTTAVGTVTGRSTSFYDTALMVTFDGSAVSVPVKAFCNVEVFPGDRVGLVKFGSEWVVVGTFTKRWIWAPTTVKFGAVSGSATGSFSDYPNAVTTTFTKYYDESEVHVEMSAGAWASAGSPFAVFGLQFSSANMAATDYEVVFLSFNVTGQHLVASNDVTITDLAADMYTVTPRWARLGTGTLNADTNDRMSYSLTETRPA